MSKLKIAMIGAGNIANTHLASYMKNDKAEVYAICDINEERLHETADKFNIARRYTDEDAMLRELPELEAADVCVYNSSHAPCSIKALEAGLHVMCEKPMAYSVAEAEEMIRIAEKNKRLLMIGFVLRFSNDARIAKDFIDKGYLGDLYYARAQYVRRHGNPGGWFGNRAISAGGPVIDLGVHVIDLTRYLMGNPKPISVYAVSYDNIGKRDYLKTSVGWKPKDAKPDDVCDVEDFASAIIRYDNGASTLLETAYSFNGEDMAKRQIFGTKAGLDLSDGVKIMGEYNDFLADINIKTDHYKGGVDLFDAEINHFIDCIVNGTACQAPAEDGLAVMKILEAIYESARTGHEVRL
ncbi:MAG: Gfo/Idh/MocA family oxidoreductase [Clostridia bacterium]|nr:Gfo/Idh/MocA family oxidoreductase [Clostridia bacterium]